MIQKGFQEKRYMKEKNRNCEHFRYESGWCLSGSVGEPDSETPGLELRILIRAKQAPKRNKVAWDQRKKLVSRKKNSYFFPFFFAWNISWIILVFWLLLRRDYTSWSRKIMNYIFKRFVRYHTNSNPSVVYCDDVRGFQVALNLTSIISRDASLSSIQCDLFPVHMDMNQKEYFCAGYSTTNWWRGEEFFSVQFF